MRRRSFLGGLFGGAVAAVVPATVATGLAPTTGYIRLDNNGPIGFRNNGLNPSNIDLLPDIRFPSLPSLTLPKLPSIPNFDIIIIGYED